MQVSYLVLTHEKLLNVRQTNAWHQMNGDLGVETVVSCTISVQHGRRSIPAARRDGFSMHGYM